MNIDQALETVVAPVAHFFETIVFYPIPLGAGQELPFIVGWLMAASIFTTIYFKFVNMRHFKDGVKLLFPKNNDPNAPGSITNFQALATCLSGTVGLGNIAGVAIAISIGGPGAALWMMVMAFLGMSTKFAEGTLGVKYRERLESGEYVGGPMHYLKKGLAERNMAGLGKFLAAFFAVCCIGGALGGANMFQSNQSYQQFLSIAGTDGWWADKGWLFGVVLAGFVGAVIVGGLKSIAATASRIVPAMAIIYVVAGLVVIAMNYANIVPALQLMFDSAFTLKAGLGALIGAMIQGVRRAVFSNEAGIGSAGIMHASAKTHHPVPVGFVAMLGAFIDTIIICLITALVIIFSGVLDNTPEGMAGVELTSAAFGTALPWFPFVLTICVLLFAYSTLIAWFYYSLSSIKYLMGDKVIVDWGYKCVFLLCTVLGAAVNLEVILGLSDALYFMMAIPNIIGIYLLAGVVKHEYKDYCAKQG